MLYIMTIPSVDVAVFVMTSPRVVTDVNTTLSSRSDDTLVWRSHRQTLQIPVHVSNILQGHGSTSTI